MQRKQIFRGKKQQKKTTQPHHAEVQPFVL